MPWGWSTGKVHPRYSLGGRPLLTRRAQRVRLPIGETPNLQPFVFLALGASELGGDIDPIVGESKG